MWLLASTPQKSCVYQVNAKSVTHVAT